MLDFLLSLIYLSAKEKTFTQALIGSFTH